MKVFIIYDSVFGNTEKIAQAMRNALETRAEVTLAKVSEVSPGQMKGSDVVIVGSPTRAFRPTQDVQKFLKSLTPADLSGVRAASFDTRIALDDTSSGFLRLMIKFFGYADKPIATALQKNGATLALPSAGFCVTASEGPLKDGELERAAAWVAGIS